MNDTWLLAYLFSAVTVRNGARLFGVATWW